MKVVVDTNVTVVANGRSSHVAHSCQYACVSFLENIASTGSRTKIGIDAGGLILAEYKDHLSYSGQPGVGDMFFKYLHDSMYNSARVERVKILQLADDSRGFAELPTNKLDKSDRKFLAVAVKAKARIVNAVDSDWHEQKNLTNSLKISVKQLCPAYGCKSGVKAATA